MCTIIAKYFNDHGWVGAKNRDRNYVPEIEFERLNDSDTGVERLLFEDEVTQYAEGINSAGVAILSASLQVQDDEKEISKASKKKSPDGEKIKRALKLTSAKAAAEVAAKLKLTGNTIILDQEDCYLLESCNLDGKYHYELREVPRDQTVARTNHGIWLPWAGYQRDKDKNQTLSRISSEARRVQGALIVDTAQDPEDMVDGLCQVLVDNPQLNVMRTDTKTKKMRTTAQLMVIPKERTLFVRPVASDMKYDFWKLNKAGADTWVEILSNRALYEPLKDDDEPPFDGLNNTHEIN